MVKPEIDSHLKRLGYDWISITPEDVGKNLKNKRQNVGKLMLHLHQIICIRLLNVFTITKS